MEIHWDNCCKRWRKDIDRGSWIMDEHEYSSYKMETEEMLGNTVSPEHDLTGKYIVWSPEATQPPRVVFDSKPDAIKAAYGMAKRFPGNRFTVCAVEGVAEVEAVKYVDLKAKAKR